jgi:membrane protease YdiL (CAAX protease family)
MPPDDGWGHDDESDAWDDSDEEGDRGDEWGDPAGVRDDDPDGVATPAGGKPPRDGPFWAVGAVVGLTIAAFLVGGAVTILFVLGVSVTGVELGLLVSLVLSLVLLQYVGFGSVSLGYLYWREIDLRDYVGIEVPSLRQLGITVGGWLVALILIFAASIVVTILGLEPAQNQTTQQASQDPVLFLYLVPLMFLIVGPMEELLFRGIVQGRLREALSPVPAIFLTAAIFAPVHVIALTGGLTNRLTTIAILFVPSLVFGTQYEYTDNLAVNALTHAIYNSTLLLLGYLGSTVDEEAANEGANALLSLF